METSLPGYLTMERFVPTTNEELIGLHEDYHLLAKQVGGYTEEIEKLEESRNKAAIQAEKVRSRLKELAHELVTDLGEYEFVMDTVKQDEGGMTIKVVDKKEETLEVLKKKAILARGQVKVDEKEGA
jgi:hypothetical protein